MIAALVDTHALLKLFYSSLLAGVGVAIVFSLAILGVTRSGDMRRARRQRAASAYAALGLISLGLAAAIVVYGLVLVTHKS
jgi:F0F1-type ATP synthase membrane subunit c/vacuolar-type H+-ATPase subunit K